MPYAFPDAPQSIAIAQTCLLVYEIGKETVAGFDEFSLDNPHCGLLIDRMGGDKGLSEKR